MPDRQVIADFARSMGIATSGLRAQAGRMRVISENIANADSTAPTAGGDPYRRKVPTFSSELDRTLDANVVALGRVMPDATAFRVKHEPGNPAADYNPRDLAFNPRRAHGNRAAGTGRTRATARGPAAANPRHRAKRRRASKEARRRSTGRR